MPNFFNIWIEEADKATLAIKLTSFCYFTNQRAIDDPSCECQTHRAMRTEMAENKAKVAEDKLDTNQVELQKALQDLDNCQKQCVFYDTKVIELTKALAEAQAIAGSAKTIAFSSSKEVKEFEQKAADAEQRAENAENRASKAEARLSKIEAAFQSIV